MKTLNLKQGTQEWLDARDKFRTASEAPMMMGVSKNVSRNELVRVYATGDAIEISEFVKRHVFPKGHEVEAAARPLAEKIIGEELFPVTATDDDEYLLASFDGITMLEDTTWECKQSNEAKAALVRDGIVPEEDLPQVIQQLVVSGADRALYMVTDGTEEGTFYTWYSLKDGDEERLKASWKQFDEDVANYQPTEAKPEAVGRAPDALPALRVEVQGAVTDSNLNEFKEKALAVLGSINTNLSTDNDFADAEKTVKWCKDVEGRLDATKDQALAQTTSIDELFRTIDGIREETRAKRLELEKLVKARKQEIRDDILQKAKQALAAHVEGINETLTGVFLPPVPADFAGAMKGKRTITTLQAAADDELARAKIEANQTADAIRANLKTLEALAADYRFLFNDLQAICTKSNDDFTALVKSRIADHKAAEEKRLEDERERIRQEEEAKARREAEQEARREAEAKRTEEEPPVQTHSPSSGEPGYRAPIDIPSRDKQCTVYRAEPADAGFVTVFFDGGAERVPVATAEAFRDSLGAAISQARKAA